MTIIGGVVYKKIMIFKVFGLYLSEFLIFHHEIFFGSKTLPSSSDKHQKFDYSCLVTLDTKLKIPILAVLDDFWTFFELPVLAQALNLGH